MRRSNRWPTLVYGLTLLAAGAYEVLADESLGDLEQVEKLQLTLADVAQAAAPTVVAIRAEKRIASPGARWSEPSSVPEGSPVSRPQEQRYPVVGSGVIIRADGTILTNEHVIDGADPGDIRCTLSNGDIYQVKAVISDYRSDLAILRIDAENLPEARLGDVKSAKQGHFAVVMGNPFGVAAEGKPAMSFGIISALGRTLSSQLSPLDERYYGNLIETDARINLGNSGGPLLNIRGEVIGITTAVSSRSGGMEGVGYAIPMDDRTKSIVAQLLRGEEVEYGYLGIGLESPGGRRRGRGRDQPRTGALISNVEPNTPAAEAKLQAGDLVVEFEGATVQDVDQLIRMVGAARVGVPAEVTFYREGVRQSVQVIPARRDVVPGVNYQPPLAWRGMTLADITPELREMYSIGQEIDGVVITAIEKPVLERVEALLRDEIQEGVVVNRVNGTAVGSIHQFKRVVSAAEGPVRINLVAKDLSLEVSLPPQIGEEDERLHQSLDEH